MLNDLFRTYKKIIVAVVLLISAIFFWFFSFHRLNPDKADKIGFTQVSEDIQSYDFQSQNLTGNITFGSGGRLSAERTQPVVINVKGIQDSFAGTIKITLPGEEGKGVAYQSALHCKKGYPSRILMSVPRLGDVSFFSVEIMDQYGTEELTQMIVGASGLTRGTESADDSDQGDITEKKLVTIGLLSDHPDRLKWLDGLETSSDDGILTYRLVEINKKDLWAGAEALESLSAILVDDYDTSSLASEQKNSIIQWVEKKSGGLILGTGAQADKVLSGLGDMVGASCTEVSKESLQFYRDGESAGYLSVLTSKLKLTDPSQWWTRSISFPVSCYQKYRGNGKILLLTWSFTDQAISEWSGRESMAQELLAGYIPRITQPGAANDNNNWYLKNALYSCLSPRKSNTFYYGLFFFIYLFVLVFFSYYILRRINKREYIWLVVPFVSILFSLAIIIRTGGLGSNSSSTYSAVEIVDSRDGLYDAYFLYQNNEGEKNNVDLISDVVSVQPLDYSYRNGEEEVASLHRLTQDYTINNIQSGFDIDFEETVPGTTRILQMMKKVPVDQEENCFETSFSGNYTSFNGTVKNCSEWTFSNVVLTRGNQYCILSNLKPGESRSFSEKAVKCWSGYDQENEAYSLDIGQVDPTGLTGYIRYRYINDTEDFNKVIVAGITNQRAIPLLKDQAGIENQQSVIVSRVTLPMDRTLHYISDINRRCLGSDNNKSSLSRDILEENNTKAVYQFDRDKLVWCAARNKDKFEGKIYAFNYETGKDELIFQDKDDVYSGKDLEPYLSEMNKMILTFHMKNEVNYGPAPVITVVQKDVN